MMMNEAPFPFSLPEGDVLCAVSGGVDSMCLLELSRRRGGRRRVGAAHFHHGLRGAAADSDEAFVRSFCARSGIPFYTARADVAAAAAAAGRSIEETGRQLRYDFLETVRRREGYAHILTAHHADDSAETVLLNLIRGTGLRGLCGIPPRRGAVVRPLLHVRRREIESLAQAWGVPHVEDETNGDPAWGARNRLRREVMPLLEAISPGAAGRMAAAAVRLREDEAALSAQAKALVAQAQITPGVCARICRRSLDDAPPPVAARAVQRLAGAVCGGERNISAAHVAALLHRRRASLPGGATAWEEGGALHIARRPAPPPPVTATLGDTVSFGPWRVTLSWTAAPGAAALSAPAAAMEVTSWRPQDRLNGRTLKRLWAEGGVAAQEREALPVLRISGRAAAVPGLAVENDFAPGRHAVALWVRFEKTEGDEGI